jgi:hypothetical protein
VLQSVPQEVEQGNAPGEVPRIDGTRFCLNVLKSLVAAMSEISGWTHTAQLVAYLEEFGHVLEDLLAYK